ncbi:unnamed protein product [Rotaria socialis]|uniref:Xaa-Pro aminopeptidase n=1 Tax=Rotaria socialis TaxID=392032 RepID=A0A820U905_9BILA|nr:unnamed protein product [Rotaria socialis]
MDLRREMKNAGIGIYVVFSDDEHGSEYTQPYDKRRDWITGFRGSAGIAVISLRTAALWTDSRYFIQAEEELDCANWLLMRNGNDNVPKVITWLVTEASETNWSVGITPVFTTGLCSIPDHKLLLPLLNSPIERVKAQKNSVERKGMKICQIRDAIARIKHIGWIEQQLNNGKSINESESIDRLIFYLKQQDKFQYLSFETISASGDRAAVIHYSPTLATARSITKDKIYLLDAGSQYLDCTTDITRTHHFGTPKYLEKRAYTRVLQGVLEIANAIFPKGTYGRSLDYLGRMYLYRDGMTFGHGIGHGIGHFLGVHEGPQSIALEYNQFEEALVDGMFISNEPGFYKPDDFGIRIENDMEVILANKSAYNNKQFLRFNTITLVPYERSLIDVTLLTKVQLNAINQYHAKVAKILEPLLKNDKTALNALYSRTKPINRPSIITKTSELDNRALPIIGSSKLITFIFIVLLLH